MADRLQEILANKHVEVTQREQAKPFSEVERAAAAQPRPKDFCGVIQSRIDSGRSAVIAEVKKASPSKGVIRADFDPIEIARSYIQHDATCISVLTDEQFFQGHDNYLAEVSKLECPTLRKDFTLTRYQIAEARALGASCILLIVAALPPETLRELAAYAAQLELATIVEVHDEAELEQALAIDAQLIGVNNRNLKTFETNLETSLRLHELAPSDCTLISESGIHTRVDVALLKQAGIHAFLVGEAFMRAPVPGAALAELFSN